MTIIYFILILGTIVFVHEFGHFIFAKKSGIYVYEFSIGMGPTLFKWKRKNDETDYSIRLFPIGGFVSMAGEQVELDENVPKQKMFQSKKWYQKFLTVSAGILFNFIFSIILLFIVGLVGGVNTPTLNINEISENSAAYEAGIETGHRITKINSVEVRSYDKFMIELQANYGKEITLELNNDNQIKEIKITPKQIDDKYEYGFSLDVNYEKGLWVSVKYAFTKFASLIIQMATIIKYLVIGKLSLNNLSGPVGIYSIVGESAKAGLINIVYLLAYISLNVGFVNLIPIPAFDGGRLLFLIIEKIKGKPINPKIENIIHTVGFVLLMILIVLITFNDILRLIK